VDYGPSRHLIICMRLIYRLFGPRTRSPLLSHGLFDHQAFAGELGDSGIFHPTMPRDNHPLGQTPPEIPSSTAFFTDKWVVGKIRPAELSYMRSFLLPSSVVSVKHTVKGVFAKVCSRRFLSKYS